MPTTTFVWDPVNDCVISELDGTGATQAVYTNEPQQYGGVLSQRRGSTSSFLHADALGTTRLLTSTAGVTTDTYLFDAWGNPVSSTGSTVNPFRWVGRYGYYTDNATGLVYVRARMYAPTIARWVSVDPIGFIDGANRYLPYFVPATIDPSGTFALDAQKAVCCSITKVRIRVRGFPILSLNIVATPSQVTVMPQPGETADDACKRIAKSHVPDAEYNGMYTSCACSNGIDYGCYCGPNREAPCDRNGDPESPLTPAPIDDIDRACTEHDCCLRSKELFFFRCAHKQCNTDFISNLAWANCDKSPNPEECRSYRNRAILLTYTTLNNTIPLP
ncbi:MAG: hypothetical protein JNL58_31540 [Planctomyces sp.]|nr:hypothetical protein [Planctomyces sp.]